MADESPSSAPPASLPPVSAQPVSAQPVSAPVSVQPLSRPSGPISVQPTASGSVPVSVVSASIAATPMPKLKEVALGRMLHDSKPPPRALYVFIASIAALALWLGLSVSFLFFSGRDGLISIVIVSIFLGMPASLAAQWAYARGMLYVAIHENGISLEMPSAPCSCIARCATSWYTFGIATFTAAMSFRTFL